MRTVFAYLIVVSGCSSQSSTDECGATRLDWSPTIVQGNTCDGTDHGDIVCGASHVPDAFYRFELPANETCTFRFGAGLNAAYGEIGSAACTDFSTCQHNTITGGSVSFTEPTPKSIHLLIETTSTACGPFTLTIDGCTP